MHLSADRTWATVVSIPRDSMTPAPPRVLPHRSQGGVGIRQWNQNYRIGGTGCLIRTLEGNTGLFVDHYAVVDFRGFKQMVDALGGVEVCTTRPIDDRHTHLQLEAGRHTLDGRQALQYVRVRKSVGDGSDLGRIERQQAFLASVMQEATSTRLLVQPTRLYSFLDAATRSLTTDPDFGLGTMRDLASSVKGIGLDEIQFVTVPNEAYAADPNRVQWKASADQIWSALREDRPVGGTKKAATASPSPAVVPAHGVAGRGLGAGGERLGRAGPGPPGACCARGSGLRRRHHPQRRHRPHRRTRRVLRRPGRGCQDGDGGLPRCAGQGDLRLGAVRVTLGSGAPQVVEVENRLGSEPLPEPTVSALR